MVRRKRGKIFVSVAVVMSLLAIAVSSTSLVRDPRPRAVLLGTGVLGLAGCLILLQLSLFREGDERGTERAVRPDPPKVSPAPRKLRSARLRTIWNNMEETRVLMERKEEEARREERGTERSRLGLPDQEVILFIGERSLLRFWPVALLSVILVTASTTVSGTPSLVLLVAGLFGFLFLAMVNRLTRYYMTNYRVLVRRRSLLGRRSRWRAMHYPDIDRCSVRKAFIISGLCLTDGEETIEITGLSRVQLEMVTRILQEKVPGIASL